MKKTCFVITLTFASIFGQSSSVSAWPSFVRKSNVCLSLLEWARRTSVNNAEETKTTSEAIESLRIFRQMKLKLPTATASFRSKPFLGLVLQKRWIASRIKGIETFSQKADGENIAMKNFSLGLVFEGADIQKFLDAANANINSAETDFSEWAREKGITNLHMINTVGSLIPAAALIRNYLPGGQGISDPALVIPLAVFFYGFFNVFINTADYTAAQPFFRTTAWASLQSQIANALKRIDSGEDTWVYDGRNYRVLQEVVDRVYNSQLYSSYDNHFENFYHYPGIRRILDNTIAPNIPKLGMTPPRQRTFGWMGVDFLLSSRIDGTKPGHKKRIPQLTLMLRGSATRPLPPAKQSSTKLSPARTVLASE